MLNNYSKINHKKVRTRLKIDFIKEMKIQYTNFIKKGKIDN